MARRNFYEIINDSTINIKAEYDRLYDLYHYGVYADEAINEWVEEQFLHFDKDFRKRTISLEDFNKTFQFEFGSVSHGMTIEKLILFCEYLSNICNQLIKNAKYQLYTELEKDIQLLREAIGGCIDTLGLMLVQNEKIVIYVEKNPEALAVAEIVPKELSFPILEYNHFRLKGDLNKKKQILKAMADNIENQREDIRNINAQLESQLYQLMNKFIRHDHSKTEYIMGMSKEELEDVYDDIYQLWLLAKLEIDNRDRRKRMKGLLEKING